MDQTTPKKFMRIADILTSKGYRIGQQIGEGTYSKVRTLERISDGKMCAVKIIDKLKARKDYIVKFLPRELEIILRLKHENVVETFDCFQTKDYVFEIMQYAENGDVLRLIRKCQFIPEQKARSILKDALKGLKYMHDMNIAHRDLKCENILILKDNTVVISDFGFSRAFEGEPNDVFLCHTFCGSAAYASPELLRGTPYNPKLNDVWSMGVILFTMLCGTMPFDDSNATKQVQQQLSRDIKYPSRVCDRVNEDSRSFVSYMLDPNTNTRPSADDLLSSEWILRNGSSISNSVKMK